MSRIALAIPVALILLLLAMPTQVADAAEAPKLNCDPQYADTAIGALIDANDGKIPATGIELVKALAKLGDFLQLAIPFSSVDTHSGLTHPRIVMAMRPATHPAPPPPPPTAIPNVGFGGGGGWGGSRPKPAPRPVPHAAAPTPHAVAPILKQLGRTAANVPDYEGRLFLAANTEVRAGQPVVKSVEFLSWNTSKLKFDFGVIEGLGGGTPVLKVLDGTRCFSCHKNRGPILGDAPWSNSMHNDAVRTAAKSALKFPPVNEGLGKNDGGVSLETIDGMEYLKPHAVEVDAAVRQGADRLRDRATVERLVKAENGKQALTAMLVAIASRKPIDDKVLRAEINQLHLVKFLQDDFAAQKVAPPNRLLDFKPAGTLSISIYDAARAGDEHGLPSAQQPSNPKAYVRHVAKAQYVSEVISEVGLARAIGLSEADRIYLANLLVMAAEKFGSPTRTPAEIAKEIFAGPKFADLFETGVLPDRDDFKDRFVAGVDAIMEPLGKSFRLLRSEYASANQRDPKARAEPEKAQIPSHACLACHDVRGAKPAAFNPIPALAFDPFDPAGRSAWLKTADRAKRIHVLTRLVQRVNTDRDMPPEDSREAETFRGKDFDAVKDWLLAELKRAKG